MATWDQAAYGRGRNKAHLNDAKKCHSRISEFWSNEPSEVDPSMIRKPLKTPKSKGK